MSKFKKKNDDTRLELDKEIEIEIPLENFKYSNTTNDSSDTNCTPKFFGRTRELDRLVDHLHEGSKNENFRGSFLVAGYRGVGKTRFVNEALKKFKEKRKKKNIKDLIDVRINLGSEKNINSKNVLVNMVSLLRDRIEDEIRKNT